MYISFVVILHRVNFGFLYSVVVYLSGLVCMVMFHKFDGWHILCHQFSVGFKSNKRISQEHELVNSYKQDIVVRSTSKV